MRHEQLSDLHKKNLEKQDEELQKRKDEIKRAIHDGRQQFHEVQTKIGGQDPPDADLVNQRVTLETQLQQLIAEYGQVQERIESSRSQGQDERGVGAPPSTPVESEARVGMLNLLAGASSWRGNKDTQEDRYVLDIKLESSDGQKLVGYAVLDGHSGCLCVETILQRLPGNIQKCLLTKPALTEEYLRQALTEAFVLTDDDFLSKAQVHEVLDGSTLIMVLIWEDKDRVGLDGAPVSGHCKLLVANVGDSRAVLCRASPEGDRLHAIRLSDDHKPGRPDERSRIEGRGGVVHLRGVWRVFTPEPATFGGRTVRWGLAVSRAFGDLLLKRPQNYGCSTTTGDLVTAVPEIHIQDLHHIQDRFLIIACDGIWDVLGDSDAIAVCADASRPGLAAQALVRRAFEIGSDDNLTALVLIWQPTTEVEDPQPKRSRRA